MSLFQSRANLAPRISPLWVLVYLPLHQFIAQTTQCKNAFLYLRVAFLIVVCATLILRQESSQLKDIFIGRWLKSRMDWVAGGLCLLLVLGTQEILARLFHYRREEPSAYLLLAIAAPINEEVIFRGLFLGALLSYFPRWPIGAVLLTTAMFLGCHDLSDSNWAVWVALSIQSIIYGVCYLWTGCVPVCILCHWLWNTLFFIG
jgi:membrane protease YdiL (CAAX protease family)